MNYNCVFCFQYIGKGVERFRIEGKGKFDVVEALKIAPINIRILNTFICKHCPA